MKRVMLKWMAVLIMLLLSTKGFAKDIQAETSYKLDTVIVTAKRTEERL